MIDPHRAARITALVLERRAMNGSRSMAEYKRALTPHERIKCAYLHFIRGVAEQDLAVAFETNGGRVSEAVQAIEIAANDPSRFAQERAQARRAATNGHSAHQSPRSGESEDRA